MKQKQEQEQEAAQSVDGLARRYRPRKFHEVVGQAPAVQAVQNALHAKHASPAYLFFGPRGVGKTTLARLIALRVNCENPSEGEPCGTCKACQAIGSGHSLDVLEIDAASHRGIDHIRELRENVKFLPMSAQKKVYIIDEVHMLTPESFNALLKTLEEPPEHVLFVLATTESHKVPQTILSRCQVFNLRKVSLSKLQEHLRGICEKEGVKTDEESLFWIARSGDGSLRDSISFLEQNIHYCDKNLEAEKVKELIGRIPIDIFRQLSQAILRKESSVKELLAPVQDGFAMGLDLQRFVWEFLDFIRTLLYIKKNILDPEFLGLPAAQIRDLSTEFAASEEVHLQLIFQGLYGLLKSSQELGLRSSYEMQVLIEMELISIREKIKRPSLSGVLQKLNQFSTSLKDFPKDSPENSLEDSLKGSPENSLEGSLKGGSKGYSFEHELQKQFLGEVLDPREVQSIEPAK